VNYGELDYLGGHDGSFQNVQTVAGQSYALAFDARSRPGLTAATCSIEVLWNSTVVATVPPGNAWATYTFTVSGTGGSDRLTFREVQSQGADGLGALYDNIRLSAANPPDGTLLSFANTNDRAKIVHLSAGFWADAARIRPLGDSNGPVRRNPNGRGTVLTSGGSSLRRGSGSIMSAPSRMVRQHSPTATIRAS
jgi:hypothetical protein